VLVAHHSGASVKTQIDAEIEQIDADKQSPLASSRGFCYCVINMIGFFAKIVRRVKGDRSRPIQVRPISREQLKKEAEHFAKKYGGVIEELSRE